MTSLSENEQQNEINIDSKQCDFENDQSLLHDNDSNSITTVIPQTLDNHQTLDENGPNNDLTDGIEENKVDDTNTIINPSPSIVTTDEEHQKEATVNHDEDENRTKKAFNSKVKYSSMPYHRSQYYINDHAYGLPPYYYYHHHAPPQPITNEKPTPLMFISTQQSSSSSSSSPSTARDNQTGNSTTITVSPQNLPPRLRQPSATENESIPQTSSTASATSQASSSAPTTTATTTNGRRHRNILPRVNNSYYGPHPPPLMATPPGVLYPCPPTVHQPGPIAYNIRSPDELELLAYQQQMMNLPPGSILWQGPPPTALPPHGHPHFPAYSLSGLVPPAYMFNNSPMNQSTNSFLNPDAAEWVPPQNDNDSPSSSSDNQILIDDEINFPPLSSTTNHIQTTATTNTKDSTEDNAQETENLSEPALINNTNTNDTTTNDSLSVLTDHSNISLQSNPKNESTNVLSSSQDDNNTKTLSTSPVKIPPMTYSTIISQTSENQKFNKNNLHNQQIQQQQQQQNRSQQSTNHTHNQLPPRDRTTKQVQQQQRTQNVSSSSPNLNNQRRQPFNNNNNRNNNTRNLLASTVNSPPKQQQQLVQSPSSPINDEWIEVKSKKTKKFDRNSNDNLPERIVLDEQVHKSSSPPLSLASTGDNTTPTTFTSEDDFDEKDSNDLMILTNNDASKDFNQPIVDGIHKRLNNNERLLIIMRGCPGSGKSTLAKTINDGYNGVVLSTDDYFTDTNLNTYTFDASKLDEAHRFNRRRASDALKRNITPVIIDNTNTQAWEMKPYVAMGKEAGYEILLVEPQTPWRYKARELFKRNAHNLPLRRIKEMLNRFEYDITVQRILDNGSSTTKPINILSSEQDNLSKDEEILDPISTSKKSYDIIDDPLILDDVRLCINDMIMFITSNFYQTTASSQPSSPLSALFHDLSLLSPPTTTSLPSTPSTPNLRFPRSLTRFSPTTNQDHTFNTEHILRLPSTTFTRCIDTNNLTSSLPTQSTILGKKQRKDKNKQQSNEYLLNINNNNNNMNDQQENYQQQQEQTFNVFLPEDCSDFVVIDEQNDNNWVDTVNRDFGIQINTFSDHASTQFYQQKQIINPKDCELLNIIHTELTKPIYHPSISMKHIAIQCSSDDFNSSINPSDLILIGHLSPSSSSTVKSIPTSCITLRPGYNECGIQVDLNSNNIDILLNNYSNRLSSEIIEQFYEVCQYDIQWTCLQIDEYLQNNQLMIKTIPTLRQLCLEKLDQWNEQIKSTNPSFDTKSISDLLEDINDEEIFEEFNLDDNQPSTTEATTTTTVQFNNSNEINIPLSIVNSLENLYGELPNKTCLLSNNNEISLPFDDDLAIIVYQTLQKYLSKSDQTIKPVINNQIKKDNKKKNKINSDQKWKLPTDNQSNLYVNNNNNNIPSLRQIIDEEQQAAKSQKSKKKPQLDFATEHKLKELERHFPSFDRDLLYDMFRENEYDYDLTFICISTIFDENASISTPHKPTQSISPSQLDSINKTNVEPVLESYEILRRDALRHAEQRKQCYTKAQQANRHGMSGVASFYIHRASEETQLMKEANRAACERLSHWRLKQFYQTHRLDLHGLHTDEALNLFKQIEQELNEGNRRTTPKTIEIITGYGKNSQYGGGYGKLRSVILNYLQQKNYKYSEPNKGVILLQLTNIRN